MRGSEASWWPIHRGSSQNSSDDRARDEKGDNVVARLTVAWQLDFEQALNSSDLFETLPDR
jgi:hypothetical protein